MTEGAVAAITLGKRLKLADSRRFDLDSRWRSEKVAENCFGAKAKKKVAKAKAPDIIELNVQAHPSQAGVFFFLLTWKRGVHCRLEHYPIPPGGHGTRISYQKGRYARGISHPNLNCKTGRQTERLRAPVLSIIDLNIHRIRLCAAGEHKDITMTNKKKPCARPRKRSTGPGVGGQDRGVTKGEGPLTTGEVVQGGQRKAASENGENIWAMATVTKMIEEAAREKGIDALTGEYQEDGYLHHFATSMSRSQV